MFVWSCSYEKRGYHCWVFVFVVWEILLLFYLRLPSNWYLTYSDILFPSAVKPKIIVCQNSTFWLRLYVSSHTFSKSLGGIFTSFLLVKLVKKLGNLSDFGKSMSLFARKSETDIQKQTVRIFVKHVDVEHRAPIHQRHHNATTTQQRHHRHNYCFPLSSLSQSFVIVVITFLLLLPLINLNNINEAVAYIPNNTNRTSACHTAQETTEQLMAVHHICYYCGLFVRVTTLGLRWTVTSPSSMRKIIRL